jgi:hypothetical protein
MPDLGIAGYCYADLYDPAKLKELAEQFYGEVAKADADLGTRYQAYLGGAEIGPVDESNLLIEVSRHLSTFIARLFRIETEAHEHRHGITELGPIWRFKKEFLGKRVRRVKDDDLANFDANAFDRVVDAIIDARKKSAHLHDREAAFADEVMVLIENGDDAAATASELRPVLKGLWDGPSDDDTYTETLVADIARWCKVRAADPTASSTTADWVGFKTPKKIDFFNLVETASS